MVPKPTGDSMPIVVYLRLKFRTSQYVQIRSALRTGVWHWFDARSAATSIASGSSRPQQVALDHSMVRKIPAAYALICRLYWRKRVCHSQLTNCDSGFACVMTRHLRLRRQGAYSSACNPKSVVMRNFAYQPTTRFESR